MVRSTRVGRLFNVDDPEADSVDDHQNSTAAWALADVPTLHARAPALEPAKIILSRLPWYIQ